MNRRSSKRSLSRADSTNKKIRYSYESEESRSEDNENENIDDEDDTDMDEDYKPKKDEIEHSETDSEGNGDSDIEGNEETESRFFKKSSRKSIVNNSNSEIKSIALLNKRNNKPSTSNYEVNKVCNLSDSDSSSDEGENVPKNLNNCNNLKEEIKIEDDCNDSGIYESNKIDESDYFDFTQIIERQEFIKNIENSKIDEPKLINKKQNKINKRLIKTVQKNENNDVMELLKLGEGTSTSAETDRSKCKKSITKNNTNSDEEEFKIDKNVIKNIQVTIELPGVQKKKDRKTVDVEAAIKRRFNLIKKENQIYAHKVHLLCWIAHGNYLNNVLNSPELMGIALSLIPSKYCHPPKRCDLTYLENLVEWFSNKIKIDYDNVYHDKLKINKNSLITNLENQFIEQIAYTKKYLVLMFVCLVRSLGLIARLTINLTPVPLKPPVNELISINNINLEIDEKTKKTDDTKVNGPKRTKRKGSSSKYFNDSNKKESAKSKEDKINKSTYFNDDKEKVTSASKQKASTNSGNKSPVASKRQSLRNKKSNNNNTTKTKNNKNTKLEKDETFEIHEQSSSSDNSDSDFEPKKDNKQKNLNKNTKIDRRVFSTDDENDDASNKNKKMENKNKRKTINEWIEVYLEAEEKWICCDVVHDKIHCVTHLYTSATTPVTYILGWENDCSIKDVTRRYVPHWMTVTRKQRVEPEWWDKTMRPFKPPNNFRNREEDEDLDKRLEDLPLPSTVAEYKNHPLYALKRHLLKFQAIYPPDAPTCGFFRNEAVYSRQCVVELHTRESWIKEAKCVRIGEEAYKVVKARPKYDKMTGQVKNDLPLNLYGYWQVDDYIPPPAVDGKVPRNEYGNVELYKPCMLPAGTVHLELPGLNRVAKKMGIDCASAVVGWDFHGGSSHPVLEGYVVCEEYKDILLDAWNQEVDESARRAREKVEQRVYGNWKRVIKGLLIREKLKLRYNFNDPDEQETGKQHNKTKRQSCTSTRNKKKK